MKDHLEFFRKVDRVIRIVGTIGIIATASIILFFINFTVDYNVQGMFYGQNIFFLIVFNIFFISIASGGTIFQWYIFRPDGRKMPRKIKIIFYFLFVITIITMSILSYLRQF